MTCQESELLNSGLLALFKRIQKLSYKEEFPLLWQLILDLSLITVT
jgi:hypothetical protein